mgnify:CR=1 FL=1
MKPVNRYLLVQTEIEEEEESQRAFLLPDSFKSREISRYIIVNILDCADDCKRAWKGRCIVESSMIEDIYVDGGIYQIIPDNYVVLLLEEK